MKKHFYGLLIAFACVISSLLLVSCGNKDEAITKAIDEKTKDMKEFSGIKAAVEKGVVTLSGEYADANCKSMVERAIGAIPGVKNVVDNGTVAPPPPPAPVAVAQDDPLTKGVNDAIKDFPGVKAAVNDGVVTLTGEIKKASLQKLMMTLHTLKPKKIDNQLTVK